MKKILSLILCILAVTGCISCAEKQPDESETEQTAYEDPEEITFDIKNLLLQTENNFKRSFDFTEHSTATTRKNKYLTLSSSFGRNNTDGLTGSPSFVSVLGFSEELKALPYTAKARLSSKGNDKRNEDKTVMAGVFCKKATDRYNESGLWFFFRKNSVTAFTGDSFRYTVTDSLPFNCDEGVDVRFEGIKDAVTLFINDTEIIKISKSKEGFDLLSKDGEKLTSYSGEKILFTSRTHGFFRVGTNKVECSIKTLELSHTSEEIFTPGETVYSFMKDKNYSFKDKESFMHAKTLELEGKLYADVSGILDVFDFTCEIKDGSVTAARSNAVLSMKKDVPEMDVNGTKYPFTSLKESDGTLYVCLDSFVKILGYSSSYNEESGLYTVFAPNDEKIEEKTALMAENYRLYDEIIFNYDDVECDTTGFGKYEKAPNEERLVGIAYSTWNSNTSWWKNTWGTPLYGNYDADDEELLRYHAELLTEADIDFVFIDWSNNTNVSEKTYEEEETFRIIEKAAYKMFKVWSEIPNAPKIAIMTGPGHAGIANVKNGAHQKKVDQVYSSFIENEKYKDMYFHYLGKPLLMCYGATPNQYGADPSWNDDRFTVRWVTGYVGQQSDLHDRKLKSERFWSWEERSPQTYTVLDGVVEAVTCSAATRGETSSKSELRDSGATLKKQFARANGLGAKIVLVTTWNEWTGGEQKSPDQSKDIEPSVEHGTFYYDLMREQIKKFKGKI